MYYSILIQGSPTKGTFSWISPYKYWYPHITSGNQRFPDQTVQSKKTISPLHVLQSVMTERECMYLTFLDLSHIIRSSHESLDLFLGGDIESLVIDAFEAAYDYCISLPLCLKDTHVYLDIFLAHFLTTDYLVARYSLRCVVYHMLLIHETYICCLRPTTSVMPCPLCSSLKIGPGNFLLKLRNDDNEGNLLFSTS